MPAGLQPLSYLVSRFQLPQGSTASLCLPYSLPTASLQPPYNLLLASLQPPHNLLLASLRPPYNLPTTS